MLTAEQEAALTEKLGALGYPSHSVQPGIDDIPMLYISGRLICSVEFALQLGEEALSHLVAETLTFWEETVPNTQEQTTPTAEEEGV